MVRTVCLSKGWLPSSKPPIAVLGTTHSLWELGLGVFVGDDRCGHLEHTDADAERAARAVRLFNERSPDVNSVRTRTECPSVQTALSDGYESGSDLVRGEDGPQSRLPSLSRCVLPPGPVPHTTAALCDDKVAPVGDVET